MSNLKKRALISDLEEQPNAKKAKLEHNEENDQVVINLEETTEKKEEEEEEGDEEDDDIAKLFCTLDDCSQTGFEKWQLDDNNDKIHPFFYKNTLYGKSKWLNSSEFKYAVKIAHKLEKVMEGLEKESGNKNQSSKWFGFVLVPAFEEQEDQEAFEEALGLHQNIIDAEAGIYYEDLEEEHVIFVQEKDELANLNKKSIDKMNKAKKVMTEQLDDYFTVGFCGEAESCAYPEFWGGHTDDGILVGLFATVYPDLDIEEEESEGEEN